MINFHDPWIWLAIIVVTYVVAIVADRIWLNQRLWGVFTLISGVEAIAASFFAPGPVFPIVYVLLGIFNLAIGLYLIFT